MDPVGLGKLIAGLPKNQDPNLLVGFDTSDDAGIYRLSDETAIITTADIITPPVNDAYLFGQIAAANAISDVYAMGGRPLTCLNLVAFPSKKLGPDILSGIVTGALDKITEAGAVLAGGHTIEDDEPKFGLAVTGVVHPDKFWTNTGSRPGDVLLLTKPIGSGVLFNANLKKWVSADAMNQCIAILSTLSKTAVKVFNRFKIHAATDVTGFGLAGHGYEMARASGVTLEIDMERIPIMAEALEMYRKGVSTGVNAHNRKMVEKSMRFENGLPEWHREIVFDPQTSGGLLVSVPAEQKRAILAMLQDSGVLEAACIGEVKSFESGTHLVFR